VKRVLVVDDDVAIQRHCREILEAEGFEVVTEASLGSTRRALRTRPADVLLLDLFLPDGCGFELFRTSPELLEQVPIVGMTAVYQGSANARLLTSRYPFAAILSKPLAGSAVVSALRTVLGEAYPKAPDQANADSQYISGTSEPDLDAIEPAPSARRSDRLAEPSRGLTREPPGHTSTFISPLDALKGTRTTDSTLSAWDPTRDEAPAVIEPVKSASRGRDSALRARLGVAERPSRAPVAEPPPAVEPSAPIPAPVALTPEPPEPPEPATGLDIWDVPGAADPAEDDAEPRAARDGRTGRRSIHRPSATARPLTVAAEAESPGSPWRSRTAQRARSIDRARSIEREPVEREPSGTHRRASVVERPAHDRAPEPADPFESGEQEEVFGSSEDLHTYVVDLRSDDAAMEVDSGGYEVLEEDLQVIDDPAVARRAAEPVHRAEPEPRAERHGSEEVPGLVIPDHLNVGYVGHQGRLDTTPFPLVLCRLAHEQVTGSLMLRRDQVKKIVFFEAGVPIAVKSNLLFECLGRLLVRDGVIAEEVCDHSVERLKTEGRPQGKILVEMGVLTDEDLQQALEIQFDTKLLDVFTWDAGLFQFRPAAYIDPGYSAIRRDPWATILYGVRMSTPVERIGLDLAAVVTAVPWVTVSPEVLAGLHLMDAEWDILGLVDGQRTLGDVVALTHGAEMTWRLIYGLVSIGAMAFQMPAAVWDPRI